MSTETSEPSSTRARGASGSVLQARDEAGQVGREQVVGPRARPGPTRVVASIATIMDRKSEIPL